MKRLLVILIAVSFIFGVNVVQAEGFKPDHQGSVSFSYFPDKNEYDHAGNREQYTARFALSGEEKVVWDNGLFIYGEGELYLGNVIPQQGGGGNNSHSLSTLVADVKGGVGYYITKSWSVALESGRTLDMGAYYSGDNYKWNSIKTSLEW